MTEEMHRINNEEGSADERYQTALDEYTAALKQAIVISHRTAGHQVDRRRFWASVLFTRLCSTGGSILYLCPGSQVNIGGSHWDFSSLASLVRPFFETALMLFYLGTEVVNEDESRARLLVMQLRDCTERLQMFEDLGSRDDQVLGFQTAGKALRAQLLQNSHFASLPAWLRKKLMKGDTASILTEDQLLHRMGAVDQNTGVVIRLLSSHADLSPLAYYRTGDSNRGRGEENEVDKGYMALALDFANDVLLRATGDMKDLFEDPLALNSPEPVNAKPVDPVASAPLYWEGGFLEALTGSDDLGAPMLCSGCFHDEGLRRSSTGLGLLDSSKCPNCGSTKGNKLNKRALELLAHQFFVWGTVRRCEYGGYPAVQFNQHQSTSIEVAPWLDADLRLIGRTLQVGFFGYGPRLWMVGEVEPLKALREPDARAKIISRIFNEYPGRLLHTNECFYRLRKAPARPQEFGQYDSPPREFVGTGRFDSVGRPVLYGSQDIEVCLHECRVTAEDESYLATLVPTRRLRLLNLAEVLLEEHVTEFESLDMALHMLFLAGSHSYEISREIARAVHVAGFDGLVYPSYFTLLRTGEMPFATTFGISHRRLPGLRERVRRNTIANLALFGRPIEDGLVRVQCINKVILNRVEYNVHFGPGGVDVGHADSSEQMKRWVEEIGQPEHGGE